MSTESPSLGACPFCQIPIAPGSTLIEYERDGRRAVFAECPRCEEPVRPR